MIDWANPNLEELEHSSSQCGGSSQCLEMFSLSDVVLEATLRWCSISLFLYVLLLIKYFIIYKHKKDLSPLKHAFKSTWGLGIMIFILAPVIFIGVFFVSDWIFSR